MEVSPELITNRVAVWRKWAPIKLTPPPLTKASIVVTPGITGLAIKLEDKLLKRKHRALVIALPELMEKLPSLLKGKLYVETTPDGLQVILQPPYEEPILLWKEEAIGNKQD